MNYFISIFSHQVQCINVKMKYYEMILIAVYQIDLQHLALTLKLIEIIPLNRKGLGRMT